MDTDISVFFDLQIIMPKIVQNKFNSSTYAVPYVFAWNVSQGCTFEKLVALHGDGQHPKMS